MLCQIQSTPFISIITVVINYNMETWLPEDNSHTLRLRHELGV